MRSASGSVWSCHGASPSSPSPNSFVGARHQRGALLGRQRGDARAVERDQAGEEAVEPGALLVARTARSRGRARGSAAATFWLIRPPPRRTSPSARRSRGACVKARKVSSPRAMREIAFQHALDRARRVLGLHVLVELARERRVRAEAAADQDVIAVDRVAVLVDRDARRDQADVADVVLRAGMMAAGEMDVDRRVERDARLAPRGDLLGVLLGVGGREAAAGRAGAGDEPGADRRRLRRRARAPRSRPRRARPCRPARRRSAGSARP